MTNEKEELKNKETIAPESTEELKKEDPNAPEDKEKDDYKEELDRMTQERDNYKEGLLSAKEKLKNKKDVEPEDKPKETTPAIDVDKIKADIRQDAVSDTIDNVLDEISTNASEKELIKLHYDRLQKSGYSKSNIINDLEDAKLLANKNKFKKENKEIRTALLTRQTIGNSGAGSSVRKDYEPEVKLSTANQTVLDRMNARRAARGEDPMTAREVLGK